MSEEALAKAREIAARLSGLGGITAGSDLGKRKNRWEDDGQPTNLSPSAVAASVTSNLHFQNLAMSLGISAAPGLGAKITKKIYIPVRDHPEINYLGLLIGPRGATQKQLQETTGAKIIIRGRGAQKDGSQSNTGHPDDTDDLHVALEGPEDAVNRASAEINQILYNPEQANRLKSEQQQIQMKMGLGGNIGGGTAYGPGDGGTDGSGNSQIELRIPNNMVGLVIGKGGENILRIQLQLSVIVTIAKESEMQPGDTTRQILLRGAGSAVAEAKKRIEDIINNQLMKNSGHSSGQSMGGKELDHPFVVKLPVPNDKVGIIIGKGGMTIKGIQERSKAMVQIPPGADEDNPQVRTLSIGGTSKEAVDAAQVEIFMTLSNQQQQVQQLYNAASTSLQVIVPDDKVGLIIGKGGLTVKDIQNRLNVKVVIPQQADAGSNPPVRTISIVGSMESQPMAKHEIEMIVTGNPLHGGSGGMYGQQSANPWNQGGGYGMGAMGGMGMGMGAMGYYGQMMNMNQQFQAAYGGVNPYYAAAYASQGTAATAAASEVEVPTDPTAYYEDFWKYAVYYGEAAARLYYGAWSPPEGTPPPAGVVIPMAAAADGTYQVAALSAEGDSSSSSAGGSDNSNGAVSSDNREAANGAAEAADPAASAAWEAYKREYAEWYEAHGKASGADPNPPMM